MLLFTDPGCGPCNALLPDIAKWQRELVGALTIGLISSGTTDRNRAKAAEHGISQIMLQENREVSTQFKAHGTPSAVIVSPAGLIDSPVAAGSGAIRQLVAKVTNTPAVKPAAQAAPAAAPAAAPRTKPAVKEAPLNVQAQKPQGGNGAAAVAPAAAPVAAVKGSGQPAPEVSLPDLSGNTVNLKDFEGNPTMVLFWNPGCGFCRKMADDLKAWEANPPAGAPSC